VRTSTLLRVASLLALLEVAGHLFLFLSYVPKHGSEEVAVVEAMRLHRFSFGGFVHSYWELYFGYGLFVGVSCFVESGVLWQLASFASLHSEKLRPIVALFLLGELGYAALMWEYFFLIPIASHTVMAVLLMLAFLAAKPQRKKAS